MTELEIPYGVQWELLVVNNNCTDATDEIIASFADRLPIRRLLQPAPGLSNARNKAVEEASGEYIIWTDDDVLADADWLKSYYEAFCRWPDAVVFGGPIEPWFEGDPPLWLLAGLDSISTAFAVQEFGADFSRLGGAVIPFGANYAVRTEDQRAHLYDPSLGRKQHGQVLLGEEDQVIRQLLEGGSSGWWIPNAKVKHWVPEARQTTEYIREYFMSVGATRAIMALHRKDPISYKYVAKLAYNYFRSEAIFQMLRRNAAENPKAVKHLAAASRNSGELREYFRRRKIISASVVGNICRGPKGGE